MSERLNTLGAILQEKLRLVTCHVLWREALEAYDTYREARLAEAPQDFANKLEVAAREQLGNYFVGYRGPESADLVISLAPTIKDGALLLQMLVAFSTQHQDAMPIAMYLTSVTTTLRSLRLQMQNANFSEDLANSVKDPLELPGFRLTVVAIATYIKNEYLAQGYVLA